MIDNKRLSAIQEPKYINQHYEKMGDDLMYPKPSARELALINLIQGKKEAMVFDNSPTPGFLSGGYKG